jgi:hypothetical protein
MNNSPMNPGATPNLEQPKIHQTAHPTPTDPTKTSPNRLLSDWRISLLVLIALWAVIYMAGLSRTALLDDADTVHAEAAKEMLQRHDWVTLYANGVRYLEKAPLMYWGVATSYTLFGISEWSTRLPLMLGVLAMILSTYGLGRWALGSEGGFDSGLVLATALGPFLFTRFLIPDVAVGLWLTLTFWLFLVSLEQAQPTRWTCWGLAAVCALNVLTKGLIGLVFPVGAIGLHLLLTGNLRHFFKLRLVSSAVVFFAIAAPWHILAALRNPAQGNVRGFLWFYFVNEHILRFLNGSAAAVLGVAGFVVASVDRFPSAVVAGSTAAVARVPGADDAAPARLSAVFLVERGDRGFLQPLDAAGILHDPGDSGDGAAGRRMAATGEGIRRREPGTARRADFVRNLAGSRRHHGRGGLWLALFLKGTRSGHGSIGLAAEESEGLCALVRALSGFNPAGNGSISRAVVWILDRVSAGHAG